MAYGTKADIRAITGLTSSEIDDTTLDVIISSADRVIDGLSATALSDDMKREASNNLSAFYALNYYSGSISISNMNYTIIGDIKVDKKSAGELLIGKSKVAYDNFMFIISQAPDGDVIQNAEW